MVDLETVLACAQSPQAARGWLGKGPWRMWDLRGENEQCGRLVSSVFENVELRNAGLNENLIPSGSDDLIERKTQVVNTKHINETRSLIRNQTQGMGAYESIRSLREK